MSKKKKKKLNYEPTKTEINAYDLKQDAVERLVTADETAPEFDAKELKKYRKARLANIPMWLKAFFVKFWFNGAICYFFVWGLGIYIDSQIDLLIVLALAMGMFNSLIVNNVLLFLDDGEGGYARWIFMPQRRFTKTWQGVIWAIASFLLDIIYAAIVVFVVYLIYFGINGGGGSFGVEPFSFGALYLAVDLVFIGMKFLFTRIVKDAIEKNKR